MRQTRGENNYNFSTNARNCQIIKSLLKTELMMLKRIFEQVRRWKSHLQSNEQPLFSIRVTGLSWRASAVTSAFMDKQHQTLSLGGHLASLCSLKTVLWKILGVLCACPKATPPYNHSPHLDLNRGFLIAGCLVSHPNLGSWTLHSFVFDFSHI